jgi:hypothetical protein
VMHRVEKFGLDRAMQRPASDAFGYKRARISQACRRFPRDARRPEAASRFQGKNAAKTPSLCPGSSNHRTHATTEGVRSNASA